jgi:hypothetical protein
MAPSGSCVAGAERHSDVFELVVLGSFAQRQSSGYGHNSFAARHLTKVFSGKLTQSCVARKFSIGMAGYYERRIWEPSPNAYPSLARLRRGFAYQTFVPGHIADAEWSIPTHVAEDIVRAETALRALDSMPHIAGIEALSRLLLRAESISSSQIEGLVVSQRKLAQALFDPRLAGPLSTATAGSAAHLSMSSSGDEGPWGSSCLRSAMYSWRTPTGTLPASPPIVTVPSTIDHRCLLGHSRPV